jgi:hypothetical protein
MGFRRKWPGITYPSGGARAGSGAEDSRHAERHRPCGHCRARLDDGAQSARFGSKGEDFVLARRLD